MYSDENVSAAIKVIDGYIQENLYFLHPKTVDRWWDVKHEIRENVARNKKGNDSK